MTAAVLVVALLTPTPAPTPVRAPSPVVERTVTVRDRTVRTALFTNRVAVVTVREGELQVGLRRLTLDEAAYIAYLGAVSSAGEEAASPESTTRVPDATATIVLWVGRGTPRRIEYSPVATFDLATARLVSAIDDLERTVLEASPSAEALRGWEPRRGERVELHTGRVAEVVEVRDDGSLVLQHVETALIEVVPAGLRDRVILRVLPEAPR